MKKLIINSIIVLLLGVLSPQLIRAQGTITYLSNLEQPSAGSDAVGSNSWLAVDFTTGPNANGYMLNSIQLGMTDASGNPAGFEVMIYNKGGFISGGILPGSSVGTLDGSLSPVAGGVFTYTPDSGLTLSPSTDYFIVLTAGTVIANGAYDWSVASANFYNPNGGWHSPGGVLTSSNGSSWSFNPIVAQFAINATAIPEPSATCLILFGSGVLFYVRRTFHR
jgi:hypothetical protein